MPDTAWGGVFPSCRSGLGRCDFERERQLQTSVPFGTRRLYAMDLTRPADGMGRVGERVSCV
jgi:hypothetical protein